MKIPIDIKGVCAGRFSCKYANKCNNAEPKEGERYVKCSKYVGLMFIILMGIVLFSSLGYAYTLPSTYYTFDNVDINATNYIDDKNTTNNNDGKLFVGLGSKGVTGVSGQAMHFLNSTYFNITKNLVDAYDYSFWVKFDSDLTSGIPYQYFESRVPSAEGSAGEYWTFGEVTGECSTELITFYDVQGGAGYKDCWLSSQFPNSKLVAGKWYFIAFQLNTTLHHYTLFLNGTRIGQPSTVQWIQNPVKKKANSQFFSDSAYPKLGARVTIDEFGFWSALTQADISHYYNGGNYISPYAPTSTNITLSLYNITSSNVVGSSTGWRNTGMKNVNISSNLLTGTFTASANSNCTIGDHDYNYSSAIAHGIPLATTSTTSHSFTYPYSLLTSKQCVYISCIPTSGTPTPSSTSSSGCLNVTQFAPTVAWKSQKPTDLNSTNAIANPMVISYNITTLAPATLNVSRTLLYHKINGTTDCFIYNNGTCLIAPNVYSTVLVTITNKSNMWNFTMYDNTVYPYTSNFNQIQMEATTHTSLATLSTTSRYIKVNLKNVSNKKTYSFWEIMANNTGTGTAQAYYCNSTYTTGNPATSTNCYHFGSVQGSADYNHRHSIYSAHQYLAFPVNKTTGKIGTVYVTENSYFLVRGLVGTNAINVFGISNVSRTDAIRYTTNSGNTWSSISGTVDSHLHQFNGTEYLNYFATSCNKNGLCTNSTQRTDKLDLAGIPPSAPSVYKPTALNYTIGNVLSINYTKSESPNGYTIVLYNITLYNATNDAFVKVIKSNNSQNLSYLWDTTTTIKGNYSIKVNACDSAGQCSAGFSDIFGLNSVPYILQNTSGTTASNYKIKGQNVTFSVNGTDADSDSVVLYICSNNALTPALCTNLCTSSSIAWSAVKTYAGCNYTTVANTFTNTAYGFVWDGINKSNTATISYFVQQLPTISSTIFTPSVVYNNNDVNCTFNATDGNTDQNISGYSSWYQSTNNVTWTRFGQIEYYGYINKNNLTTTNATGRLLYQNTTAWRYYKCVVNVTDGVDWVYRNSTSFRVIDINISNYNVTSPVSGSRLGWNLVGKKNVNVTSNSLKGNFTSNIPLNCSMSRYNLNFSAMIANNSNTKLNATWNKTSHYFTYYYNLTYGVQCVYLSCARPDGSLQGATSTSGCLNVTRVQLPYWNPVLVNQTAHAGLVYNYDTNCSGNGTITYGTNFTSIIDWTTFNSTTGLIHYEPQNHEVGLYRVKMNCTSTYGTNTSYFWLNVLDPLPAEHDAFVPESYNAGAGGFGGSGSITPPEQQLGAGNVTNKTATVEVIPQAPVNVSSFDLSQARLVKVVVSAILFMMFMFGLSLLIHTEGEWKQYFVYYILFGLILGVIVGYLI